MTEEEVYTLYDYDTAEPIRPATQGEYDASAAASQKDGWGGAGVIDIDSLELPVETFISRTRFYVMSSRER